MSDVDDELPPDATVAARLATYVRAGGVVQISVCCRLIAAIVRSSSLIHGKNQFRPVPLKIAL